MPEQTEEYNDPKAGEKSHRWFYRPAKDGEVTPHEWGNAITKAEASRRIAKMYGVDELPTGSLVTRREPKTLVEPEEYKPETDAAPASQDKPTKKG